MLLLFLCCATVMREMVFLPDNPNYTITKASPSNAYDRENTLREDILSPEPLERKPRSYSHYSWRIFIFVLVIQVQTLYNAIDSNGPSREFGP